MQNSHPPVCRLCLVFYIKATDYPLSLHYIDQRLAPLQLKRYSNRPGDMSHEKRKIPNVNERGKMLIPNNEGEFLTINEAVMDSHSVVPAVEERVEMLPNVVVPKERHPNIEIIGGGGEMEDDSLQVSVMREGGSPEIAITRSAAARAQHMSEVLTLPWENKNLTKPTFVGFGRIAPTEAENLKMGEGVPMGQTSPLGLSLSGDARSVPSMMCERVQMDPAQRGVQGIFPQTTKGWHIPNNGGGGGITPAAQNTSEALMLPWEKMSEEVGFRRIASTEADKIKMTRAPITPLIGERVPMAQTSLGLSLAEDVRPLSKMSVGVQMDPAQRGVQAIFPPTTMGWHIPNNNDSSGGRPVNGTKGEARFRFRPDRSGNEHVMISMEERKNWSGCSIFKIPKGLRDIDPNSYTPKIVSIGPIHRSESHLKPMQEHKWRFLARMLARTQRGRHVYARAISELKDRARDCYSWRTEDEIDDEEFEVMLLLDACFIVELLLAFDHGYVSLGYPRDDPIFAARGLVKWIQRDLLLLENQIPLFIVDRVFQITTSCGSSVATLALRFFESAIPGYVKNSTSPGDIKKEELHPHLLGAVWQCIVPSQWLGMRSPNSANPNTKFYQVMLPPISTLRDSGVKFVKKESSGLTEVDFDLERGMLYIPPLVIDDSISTFLNLTALEQCYPYCHDEMSLYVTLLDGLIDSPEDVAHLQRKGIIDNRLGSDEEVAKLFNRVCREIVVDRIRGSRLSDIEGKLRHHLDKNWPSWRVSLKREHFRHPWSILSVIAAVILLILTIMQVVYAMIAYHLPP